MQKFQVKFVQRGKSGKRSGMIALSSIRAQYVMSGRFLYCATKAFVKYLSLALKWEAEANDAKVDILSLQPYFVATRMVAAWKGTEGKKITVEECVSAALRDLGKEETTYGPFLHEKWGYISTVKFKLCQLLGVQFDIA